MLKDNHSLALIVVIVDLSVEVARMAGKSGTKVTRVHLEPGKASASYKSALDNLKNSLKEKNTIGENVYD